MRYQTFCSPENIIEGLKNKTFTTGPTNNKMDVPLSRAEEIIKSGKLVFSPQLGTFTVMGFSDVPRVVLLYPNIVLVVLKLPATTKWQ